MTYARMGWAFLLTALLCVPSFALAGQKIDLRQSDGTITELGGDGSAAKTTLATTLAGEDIVSDVLKVEQRFAYRNITLANPTTTVVKSGPGLLHLITVNKTAAFGVITCYDNTAGSGTVIATITQPATLLASQISLPYDVAFSVGLTCVTETAAQDITVSYR